MDEDNSAATSFEDPDMDADLYAPKVAPKSRGRLSRKPLHKRSKAMPPSFMKFPTEIRLMIYEILLLGKGFTITPTYKTKLIKLPGVKSSEVDAWSMVPSAQDAEISTAICRTSRIIASESLPVLYGKTIFHFQNTDSLSRFCQMIGTNRLHIKKVDFSLVHHCLYHKERRGTILKRIRDLSSVLNGLDMLPDLENLRINADCSATRCNIRTALTTDDSDVALSLFEARLNKIKELKFTGIVSELQERVLDFWKSGEESGEKPVKPNKSKKSKSSLAESVKSRVKSASVQSLQRKS